MTSITLRAPEPIEHADSPAEADADPLTAVIGLGALWLIGLVIVGLPMLVVTTPCAVAWAGIVRLLVRRGGASS
jgi:hypothetical protein